MNLKESLFALIVVLAAAYFPERTTAQTTNYYWSGAGDGATWSQGTNWVNGIAPVNDGTTYQIYIGTGDPTLTSTPINISSSDHVVLQDQLFGPEWGETLNIYGSVNAGYGFCPLGDENGPKSTVNLYGTGSFISSNSIFIGDPFWFAGGPNVDFNLYDNSTISSPYLALGGHLNLYNNSTATISLGLLTGTLSAGAFGGISSDLTRWINLAGGKLILPTGNIGFVKSLIGRGIFLCYGEAYDTNAFTMLDDGTHTTIYASTIPPIQTSGNVFTNQSFNNGEPYYQLIIGVTNSNAGLVVNSGSVFNLSDIPALYPVDRLILGLGATTNNSLSVSGTGSQLVCNNLSSGGSTFIYYWGDTEINSDVGIWNYAGNQDHIIINGGGGIECFGNTFEGQGQISLGNNNTVLVSDYGSYMNFNYGFSVNNGNVISVLNGASLSGPGISLGNNNAFLFSDSGTSVDAGLGSISGDSFNSLTVSNGASVSCYSFNFSGVSNTLVFDGTQTLCTATNGIEFDGEIITNGNFAGKGYGGNLLIKNGAEVIAGGLYAMGSPGTQMIVSDPGSSLTLAGQYRYFVIGFESTDTNALVIVTNGATVNAQVDCLMDGQSGLLTVAGANSLFSSTTNSIYVGGSYVSSNLFIIGSGGSVVAGSVSVGSTDTRTGLGNSMTVSGNLYVTNSTGTAVLAIFGAQAFCNGGLIVADELVCGAVNGVPGTFAANSGTLQFKSAIVTNGLPFILGDGTNKATLVLSGGTNVFGNGLVINSNSVFSAAGTITGNVTNYGTIIATGNLVFQGLLVNFGTITTSNTGTVQLAGGLSSPPVVWNSGSGHNNYTYQVFYNPSGLDWNVAEANAEAMGGHLASITSAQENAFVYSLVSNNAALWITDVNGNGIGLWIGGFKPISYSDPAAGWRWSDGSPYSYANWAPPFEPNNLNGIENRIILFAYQAPKGPTWDDYPNSPTPPPVYVQPKPFASIVEFPPVGLNGGFVSGDIAVLRVQDNSGVLTNVSAELFLDEYTTNGLNIQSLAFATNGANALVNSGDAVAEDSLARPPNGRWLCFGAYNAPVGITNITGSSSITYPRTLVTVDVFGNINFAAANTNTFNGNNIRGAVSDGTNSFWGEGSAGLNYFGFDTSAASIYSTVLRVANIVNGGLYLSTSSGGGIYKFTGLPKSAATPTRIIATGSGSPYGFAINPSGNVAYVADDDQSSVGGVQCWTNSAGTWSLLYTLGTGIANTGARGLAVDWSGANPILYASTSENTVYGNPANRLIRIVDTGAGSAATTLATAATNSSFRGVAFTPVATGPQSQIQAALPENSNMRIYWRGIGGSNYVVQASTNLSGKSFGDITPVISLPGAGVVATNYLDAGALTNSPARFYRIRSN